MSSFNKVAFFIVFLLHSACLKSGPLHTDQSSVYSGGSLRRLVGSGLSNIIVGNAKSIHVVENLTSAQKATLLVTVENRELAVLRGNELKPVMIPYFSPKKAEGFQIKNYLQMFRGNSTSLAEQNYPRGLINRLGSSPCAKDILIPYHPDTTVMHPVLREMQKKGVDVRKSTWEAYHSMSRSLFIINHEDPQLPTLFSMKMGTNMVNGMAQDQKIYVYDEQVTSINDLTTKTSIPHLMDFFGIKFLQDTAGVQISPVGAKFNDPEQNYVYNFRDYTPLLKDKNYIYMPLDFFKWKGKLGADGMIGWELDDQIFLKISQVHLEQYVKDLAYETGKFEAILLSNGYITEYFHGQNVLVGIPLDPGNHARLGFRDVGDSEDILPRITQLKQKIPAMNEPNWCSVLRQFKLDQEQCFTMAFQNHQAGFHLVAQKLGFSPGETDQVWNLTRGKGTANSAGQDEIRSFFAQKIGNIRKMNIQFSKNGTSSQNQCMAIQRSMMRQCLSQKGTF